MSLAAPLPLACAESRLRSGRAAPAEFPISLPGSSELRLIRREPDRFPGEGFVGACVGLCRRAVKPLPCAAITIVVIILHAFLAPRLNSTRANRCAALSFLPGSNSGCLMGSLLFPPARHQIAWGAGERREGKLLPIPIVGVNSHSPSRISGPK